MTLTTFDFGDDLNSDAYKAVQKYKLNQLLDLNFDKADNLDDDLFDYMFDD